MPKLKTKRSAAKRFTKTARGKIRAQKSFRRHLLTSRTRKRKRQLRKPLILAPADQKRIERLLPY
jgi:large subunit ribosomal protein L35